MPDQQPQRLGSVRLGDPEHHDERPPVPPVALHPFQHPDPAVQHALDLWADWVAHDTPFHSAEHNAYLDARDTLTDAQWLTFVNARDANRIERSGDTE